MTSVGKHPQNSFAPQHANVAAVVNRKSRAFAVNMAAAGGSGEDSFSWAAPRLALLGMAGTCGANFPLLHMTEATMLPSDVAVLRFACALLPFLPALINRLSKHGFADNTLMPGLEIGAWCSLGYVTQAIGLAHTSPARGAFICALFLVVTPLLNGLQGRRVEAQAWLAVGIALLGTACLEGLLPLPFLDEAAAAISAGGAMDMASAAATTMPAGINMGDVWCGGTALGFGAMFSRMEAHMEDLNEDDALPMTVWQLVVLFGSVVGWRLWEGGGGGDAAMSAATATATATATASGGLDGWVDGVRDVFASEPLTLPAILFMGFISGALVLWGETLLLKSVPSTEAGVIFATEPVWAAGFAYVFLHDVVGMREIVGGSAIVLACLALQMPEESVLSLLPGDNGGDGGGGSGGGRVAQQTATAEHLAEHVAERIANKQQPAEKVDA